MEKNTCKVISGTDPSDCRPWYAPEVAGAGMAGHERSAPPTAARVEEIQRQAYEEAFALGRREGLEDGRREAKAGAERLTSIISLLGEPLRELDERMVEEVVALSVAIARHLVRRELRTDPGQIVAVVRQATAALPASARRVRIMLHPEDAAALREAMSGQAGTGTDTSSGTSAGTGPDMGVAPARQDAWQIVEDPGLARGGCRVETEHSRIDASVEKRLAAIAADLLGGERGQDADVRAD